MLEISPLKKSIFKSRSNNFYLEKDQKILSKLIIYWCNIGSYWIKIDWFEEEKNILKQTIPNWIIKYRTINVNNFFILVILF